MAKSENIIKFEETLVNDEAKHKAFDDAYKKIMEEKSVGSNNEAVVKAAKEIGFDISIEELERSYAEKQEMNDDELDKVAGAGGNDCLTAYKCGKWSMEPCMSGYYCMLDHHIE